MIRPRLRGRCLWLSLLALPVFVWVALVLLAPTGWARNLLIARLEAETGRSVRIESVDLGWNGNFKITNLSFAEHRTPTDPWLRIAGAKVDVQFAQALLGCCQVSDVEVEGVSLRVWRRRDGRFEFGDLARTGSTTGSTPARSAGVADFFPSLNLRVSNSAVSFNDETSDLRFNLTGVEARGSYKALAVKIDDLRGQLNGGHFTMAALLLRDPVTPRFSVDLQAKRVHLDHGLHLIETFVPLVARVDDPIVGFLNARLALKGQGASCGEIRRTLTGHGSLLLDPIDLDGSRILSELQALGEWPKANHVGAVSSNFTVGQGRVSTEDLTVRNSKLPFVVAGWTDFDGRFDYSTRVDQMIAALPREARAFLGELKVNLDELTGLRIAGVKDQVHLTLNGRPLSADPRQPSAERTRFRESARRIRDGFFR